MRILFADDDPVTLETLGACAEREGFEVMLAPDGASALRLWREHRPALVCLDVMMPNLDGFEVCRRIRAEDASVPVLFLSAKSEEPDVVTGLKLGADDFVRKPFGRSELLARIRSALRRARIRDDRGNASFQMGEWTIEPARLSAQREGMEIDLTPVRCLCSGCSTNGRGRRSVATNCWMLVGESTTTRNRGPLTSTLPCCGRRSNRIRRGPASSRR